MINLKLKPEEAEALGRLIDAAMRLGGIKVAKDVETFWGPFEKALEAHRETSEE